VVKVGAGGRGFVVETGERNPVTEPIQVGGKLLRPRRLIKKRRIVTAAHCLPHQPPARANAGRDDRTYFSLLGPLGSTQPSIAAECEFVDAVADIAVLGEPDGQAWGDEVSEAFHEFIEALAPLLMGDLTGGASGWLLSLDGQWIPCTLEQRKVGLWIRDAKDGIMDGMSGSPILLDDGQAVGVVTCSRRCVERHSVEMEQAAHTEGGPQPGLAAALPGWMLHSLRAGTPRKRKRN